MENAEHQRMLDRQLDLALDGSTSLNQRGTTLAGLLGATIALVAGTSVHVINNVDSFPRTYLIAMAVFFVITLAALSASVVVALTAVRPSKSSSAWVSDVVTELMCASFSKERVRSLTWQALVEQRRANDRKSTLMRAAYVLAGTGIVAVVIADALYCAAVRV